MQRVTDRVNPTYFDQPPPRAFPYSALADMLEDHLISPALRYLLDPILLTGTVVLIVLGIVKAPPLLLYLALVVILLRLLVGLRHVWRRIRDEVALLRHGLTIRAHILRLRPHRTLLGEIDGAMLDCAIAVAPRRTYIGSIWVSDGAEALRLSREGRLEVICLPRTPGTWRVIERLHSEIRYERMGPIQKIPDEV